MATNRTSHNRKKKKKDKILVSICVVLILISLVTVAGVYALNTSLFANNGNGDKKDDGHLDSKIATPTEIKEKAVNFLITGIDYVEGSGRGKLTDVIMVISLDIEGKKANVLQIPRDTFIGTDYPTGKINAIYGQSHNGGIEGLATRINELFDVKIDHYVTITMDGFTKVIDKLGGIEVNVPKYIELEGVQIQPGLQKLDGYTADKFVRNRNYKTADLERIKMQQIFIEAMLDKVLGMGTIKIATIAPSIMSDITTDLTLGEMLGYYDAVKGLGKENIKFHMMPFDVGYNGKIQVLEPKMEELEPVLSEYFRLYR